MGCASANGHIVDEPSSNSEIQQQRFGLAVHAGGQAEVILHGTPDEGEIVATVPNSDRVIILQDSGKFVKVQWNTIRGWAHTSNVLEFPPEDRAGFWEYAGDDLRWLPYSRDDCMKLDAVCERGTELSMVLGPDKMPCVVGFAMDEGDGTTKHGMQTDLRTKKTREIRRQSSIRELALQAESMVEVCMQSPPDVGVSKYTKPERIHEILGRESQSVKLLRGSWVTGFAGREGHLIGLPRRQDLEHAAFFPTAEINESDFSHGFNCLNILSISYCWLAAVHPDADGQQLRVIEREFRRLKEDTFRNHFKDAGIFWDFCSLHQKDKNGRRTETEWQMFKEALQDMDIWYLHAMIMTFIADGKLIGNPGIDYESRGWTHFERSCAELIKPARAGGVNRSWPMVTEFAESRRRLPLSPELFAKSLARRRFTSRGDKETVLSLYTKACMQALRGVQHMNLSGIKLLPGDGKQLASVLQYCCSLQTLELKDMDLDDGDSQTIASSLPSMAALDELYMQRNKLTDTGKSMFKQVWDRVGKPKKNAYGDVMPYL